LVAVLLQCYDHSELGKIGKAASNPSNKEVRSGRTNLNSTESTEKTKVSSYAIQKAYWEKASSNSYADNGMRTFEYDGLRRDAHGLYSVGATYMESQSDATHIFIHFIRGGREFCIELRYYRQPAALSSWVAAVKLRTAQAIKKFEMGEIT